MRRVNDTDLKKSAAEIDVFVIGTASLDTLHLADGRTVQTAGGAGLYTALAAQRAGARAGLFAPKPAPIPEPLLAATGRLLWVGPPISPEQLPRLEIAHHGAGRATLLAASWGAEADLISQTMPPAVTEAAIIHIAALSTAQRQLDFLSELKQRAKFTGRNPLISAGTYARLVYNDTERVRRLCRLADLFFMNQNEARGLFGTVDQAQTRPEARLFVTLDAQGAMVIEGSQATHVPGRPVVEVDPTGAGDTFCGAVLAKVAQGETAQAAAQYAAKLAAQTVGSVGPEALLRTEP